MEEQIKHILKDIKGSYFEFTDSLITDGLISSFEVMELMNVLESTFGIQFLYSALRPEDFNSVESMIKLVSRYTETDGKEI